VPAARAGDDLFSVNLKLTWLPWTVRLPDAWRLRPITAGFVVSYALGDRFFLVAPDKYPTQDYYPLPTAVRSSVTLGGTLGRPAGALAELGVYWELVAWDLPLALWIQNPRTVRASDVISVALGVRAAF
jgi:hypothetical protein